MVPQNAPPRAAAPGLAHGSGPVGLDTSQCGNAGGFESTSHRSARSTSGPGAPSTARPSVFRFVPVIASRLRRSLAATELAQREPVFERGHVFANSFSLLRSSKTRKSGRD